MPANFQPFISGLSNYLKSNSSSSPSDTANIVATLYVGSLTGTQTVISAASIVPPPPTLIANGFDISFKSAGVVREGKISPSTFAPAANAIIAEFTKLQIAPMPPVLPTIGPVLGYTITNPGISADLMMDIYNAFTSTDPNRCAQLLASGFIKHLSTVGGIYSGLIATPTGPIPAPPIPWSGLQ